MENIQLQQTVPATSKKKGSLKRKVYLILVIIVLGAGIYGYYWFRATQQLRLEAQDVIEKVAKYDTLQAVIQTERDRCEKFITQEEGDFGSFEYCKKFIQWVNNQNLLVE